MIKPTTTIDTLAREIRLACLHYYNNDPTGLQISDADFDAKVAQLRELAPNHPALSAVGVSVPVNAKVVRHEILMTSLSKITTRGELVQWFNKCGPQVAQLKYDGCSIELKYVDGRFRQASTRGDGVTGEDITVAASMIPDVPKQLNQPVSCYVRGEVLLSLAMFEVVGGKNPRNTGNGMIRRSDGHQCDLMNFRAYDIVFLDDELSEPATEIAKVAMLEDLGFEPLMTLPCATVEEAVAIIDRFEQHRPTMDFAIDGVVLKTDSVATQRKLGFSSGRPNGQVAYKWESEEAETVVLSVDLTVGHTGYIIPTANLKPVELMGTTVSRALLNNWDEIGRLNVAVGDTVTVAKRGEIIPKIEEVVVRPETRTPIAEPTTCPVCGWAAGRKNGGALTFCLNPSCDAKTTGKIKRWMKSLDIKGLGDDTLQAAIDAGILTTPASLYTMGKGGLAGIKCGNGVFGAVRSEGVYREIQATKALTVAQFLGSLGIEFLGKRRVEIMIEKVPALASLEAWLDGTTLQQVAEQAGVKNMVTEIVKGIERERNNIVDLLLYVTVGQPVEAAKAAININTTPTTPMNDPKFESKKTFVLTGKFDVPKAEIHSRITAAGHSYDTDMKKGVDFLVQADPSSESNKTKKAAAWGIKVIGLAELETILNG